jgi:hypothetical protein
MYLSTNLVHSIPTSLADILIEQKTYTVLTDEIALVISSTIIQGEPKPIVDPRLEIKTLCQQQGIASCLTAEQI